MASVDLRQVRIVQQPWFLEKRLRVGHAAIGLLANTVTTAAALVAWTGGFARRTPMFMRFAQIVCGRMEGQDSCCSRTYCSCSCSSSLSRPS